MRKLFLANKKTYFVFLSYFLLYNCLGRNIFKQDLIQILIVKTYYWIKSFNIFFSHWEWFSRWKFLVSFILILLLSLFLLFPILITGKTVLAFPNNLYSLFSCSHRQWNPIRKKYNPGKLANLKNLLLISNLWIWRKE